jgi:hypothetical protein
VSNPESFIDEVTEEVRRDKLFGLMRKYGWIGILLVLLIVAGAAWNEWQKAQWQTTSQAFGDAVNAARDLPTAPERAAALAAIPAPGQRIAIRDLLLSADLEGDVPARLAALDAVAKDASLPNSYRDLAVLRRVVLAGDTMPAAERRAALDPIAAPGRPYRPLALEQLALLDIEAGNTEAAITALQALAEAQEATPTLRARVEQLITALGGTPKDE